MRIKEKIKGKSGFSLAETLLATLIMLLVSVLLANGIPTIKTVYEKVTIGANARVLLSTTIASLRNELGTAQNIIVDKTNKRISYYSTDNRATSIIYLDAANYNSIMLQEYSNPEILNSNRPLARDLVTPSKASEGLYVTFKEVSIPDSYVVIFKGLTVWHRKDNNTNGQGRAYLNELKVRVAFGPVKEDAIKLPAER